ncbi:MAG TPA: PASTA domain-containing protein [Candidatus Sumerlaeota bacterium]|nr:PASTA domain-containing protein [Candidatus Sumerlaeota bacterium]
MSEEEREEEKERRGGCWSLLLFLLRMAFTVTLSVALLSTLSYFVIKRFVIAPETPVPNLVGLTIEQALKIASDNRFTLLLDRYEHSTILEQGRVLSQYPPGAKLARASTPVRIVVSRGSPNISVPDVRGETRVSAEIKIRASDLTVGSVAEIHDSKVNAGMVLAQDPPGRIGVPRGYPVNLLISLGPGSTRTSENRSNIPQNILSLPERSHASGQYISREVVSWLTRTNL